MDRTERFYKIQDLLKQHKKLTMKQLQDSLGISRATACRDLDYLRDRLGVPIVSLFVYIAGAYWLYNNLPALQIFLYPLASLAISLTAELIEHQWANQEST